MMSADLWRRMSILGLVGVLLPFELKTPLFSIGPIAVTNTELAIYVAVAAWGIGLVRARRIRWTPVHTAVLLWAFAIVISAVFTPDHRGLAVKFALRSLCGCLLFFAAAEFVSTSARAAMVVCALSAGAAVSALAGIAEMWVPGAAATLMAFKTQPSRIGGFARASGTFQYANTAVMYWEAAVPLVVTAGLWLARLAGRHAWRWVAMVALVILTQAIVLSLSRAGLAVTAATLLTLVALGRGSLGNVRAPAAVGVVALAVLALLNPRISGLVTLRLNTADELTWYRAEYASTLSSLTMDSGETQQVAVRVRNTGLVTWPAKGDSQVHLSYHWQRASGEEAVILDGMRSPLPADVPPGAEVMVSARVTAPREPGRYILQWDLVQENTMWFSIRGAKTGMLAVAVTPSARPLPKIAEPRWVRMDPEARPVRLELWRAGLAMWRERPLIGIGPDNFRHRYGPYLGLTRFDDRVHANNLYVETVVNLGILGLAALIWLFVALASLVWRARRALKDPQTVLLATGLCVSLATFFMHGLVDYFLEFTPTLGLFWLLMGTTVGMLRNKSDGVSRVA